MDEKKMAEEFAKIWKAVGENSGAIIETNKDLKKLASYHASLARHYSRHIIIFNKNVDMMNQNLRMLQKYAKRQNVAILAGIGGFLYLCKKIQKLEDVTKKE
jgi:hypothetical protein